MKNIAKQILVFTMMVLGATGAWAQTLSDGPSQQSNGTWKFTMPAGNRTLRTTWKQEIGLAWKIEEEPVSNASGYLHFRSLATLPNLYIPTNITDFGTKGKYGSSNQSVATIDNSGNVSFVGVGETTIYAVYNDDNYYDSVYYTLTVNNPVKVYLYDDPDDIIAGSVMLLGDNVHSEDDNWYYVIPGDVTVQAVPVERYYMQKWVLGEGENTPETYVYGNDTVNTIFHITQDTTITAYFAPKPTLTLFADGNGTVEIEGATRTSPWATKIFDYLHTFTTWQNGYPTAGNSYAMSNFPVSEDGPWKVEYVGEYTTEELSTLNQECQSCLDNIITTYHVLSLHKFRLYQWKEAYNDYGYYAPIEGTIVAYANESNEAKHAALFVSNWGYFSFLTDSIISTNNTLQISFDEDLSTGTGVPTIVGATTTNLPAGVMDGNAANEYIVDYDTNVTVKATANLLHFVSGWEDELQHTLATATYSNYAVTNPNKFPALSSLTFTVTGDTTAKALFGINDYVVSASVADGQSERGTVQIAYTDGDNQPQTMATTATVTSVEATALGGSQSTVTATPATGYHFTNWNGNVTTNPCTTSVAASYTVSFDTNAYVLTVLSDNTTMGGVNGGTDNAKHFRQYTISATPNPGYHFDHWNDNNTDNPRIVTLTENTTYTAYFAENPTLTLVADGDGTVTVEGAQRLIDLSTLTANYTAQDGDILTGTLDVANYPVKISVADGATVTLAGMNISGVEGTSPNYNYWAGITCLGDATIVLADGSTNIVKGFHNHWPGIEVGPTGKTLTIKGTGRLDASSNGSATSIGSEWNSSCGNITILNGTINATCGGGAAGIGASYSGSCGDITISGGSINVISGSGSSTAGIGTGLSSTCGDITINGGTVNASGCGSGAGIGTGQNGHCGDITITNGVTSVTATKGIHSSSLDAIGRGGGSEVTCGTVTIGGTVYWGLTSNPNEEATYVYKNDGANYLTHSTLTYNGNGNGTGTGSGSDPVSFNILTTDNPNVYSVYPGTEVTVKATPAANHYMQKWDNEDPINSNVAVSKSVTVNSNTTLTAHFAQKPTLMLAVNDANMGSVDVQKEGNNLPANVKQIGSTSSYYVDYGTEVTVNATANPLYFVSGWEDELQHTLATATYSNYAVTNPANKFPALSSLTFTVTGDTTAKALFGINDYVVSASVADGQSERGTVQIAYRDADNQPQTIATTTTVTSVQATALGGSQSTVTATPATGYHFTNWNGNVTTNPCTTSVAASYTVSFDTNAYVLTVLSDNTTMGGVNGGTDNAKHFRQYTISATPNPGYHFDHWNDNNTNNPRTVTLTEATTYTAYFAENPTLTLVADGNGTVTLATLPDGVLSIVNDNPQSGSESYSVPPGTQVTVTATPSDYSYMKNWDYETALNSNDAVIKNVTVNTNTTLTAHFAQKPILTLATNNNGTVAIDGTPTNVAQIETSSSYYVNYGTNVTVNATANVQDHYHFVNWTNEGGSTYTTGVNTDNAHGDYPQSSTLTLTVTGDTTTQGNFAIDQFTITATAGTGGSVSGTAGNVNFVSGTSYNHGTGITLTATPNPGYHFVNWTNNLDNTTSTVNPLEFTVTQAFTYTANFEINSYDITASTNPTEGGEVSGTGSYNHGTTAELTATANTGYTFVNWTKGTTEVCTTATYSFTVTHDSSFVANFNPNTYTVTLNTNEGTINEGNVTSYTYGEGATLPTDVTRTGYTFGGWFDNANLTGNAVTGISNTAIGDTTFWAKWTANTYNISYELAGGSVATANPITYTIETPTFTLTNPTRTGYTFAGWTVTTSPTAWGTGSSNSGATNFTIAKGTYGNITFTATWTENSYAVTFNNGSHGTVSVGGTEVANGSTASVNHVTSKTLVATANTGYSFSSWSTTDNVLIADADNASTTITATGTGTVTANWTANTYTVTLNNQNATTAGSESVTATYDAAMPNISLPAKTGYTFGGYYTGTDGNGTQYYNADGTSAKNWDIASATTLYAKWTINQYTITFNSNGGSDVASITQDYGTNVTAPAAPTRTGYTFAGWNPAVPATMPASNTECVAQWTENSYAVTFNNGSHGTVSLGGTEVANGSTASVNHVTGKTLVATASTGYSFNSWSTTSNVLIADADNASTTITATGTGTVTANWTANTYTVTLDNQNATTAGSESVTATYDAAMPSIVLPAKTGYTFGGYYTGADGDGTQYYKADGTSAKNWDIASATTLYAKWTINQYTITATANPTEGGNVTGAGIYDYNTEISLTATPATGHHFVNWTKGTTEVCTTATYSFTVTKDSSFVANFNPNTYTVTLNTNGGNINEGNVTSYTYGVGATLPTNVTKTGYTFDGWYTNVNLTGDKVTSISATETGNKEFWAKWTINSYTLTVNYKYANNTQAAETHTESVNYNASFSVASPAITGYTPSQATVSGTMPAENVTVDVTYNINSYTLTLASGGNGSAAVKTPLPAGVTHNQDGSYTVNHGTELQIEASPADHYHFVKWNDNNTDNPRMLTITKDSSFTASFAIDTYTLTLATNGYGTVALPNPLPDGVTGSNGTYTVNYGTQVTVTATPATHHYMQKWDDEDPINSNVPVNKTVTVTENTTLTAYFAQKPILTLSTNPSDPIRGYVTIAGTTLPNYVAQIGTSSSYYVDYDSSVTVKATPIDHYHLASWNNTSGNALQQEVTMTSDMEITGVFAIDTFTLTLKTNDIAMGKAEVTNHSDNPAIVSHDPDANGTRTYKVNYGAEVIIKAFPKDHYHLESWSNGATVNPEDTIHVIVTDNSTITANFAINTYTISASVNPTEGGTVSGAGSYTHGASCTLTATPATGYHFVNWTDGNEVVSTNATYAFTVNGTRSLVANFSLNTYAITANANPTEGGTVTGGDTYHHGNNVTLTATANTGYTFTNWTKDNAVVSTNATYSFTATEAANYVANFTLNSYTITVTANPTASGTLTGAGSYNHGTICTLTATANEGYAFSKWTENGDEVSTDATYSFTVTGARNLVAVFDTLTYSIAVTADPAEGGTITGTGIYKHFETCTLTATPTTGYHFVNWTENDTVVANAGAEYTFTVTGARNLMANFAINTYTLTLAADGDGTVTLDGLNIETFNNLHSGQSDYTGENIKLHVDNPLDGGFQIWHNNFMIYYYYTATITSLNGENITKVELTRGSTSCYQGFYNDLNRLTVNQGTLSVDGDMATITGINATSLTIGAQLQTDIRIGKVKVYYGTPPEGITEYTENNAIVENKYHVTHGTELTVKAAAAPLHHVAGWSDEEQHNLSDLATYSNYAVTNPNKFPAKSSIHVTVTGDTTMMATFYLNSYEVNAAVANGQSERGTVQVAYTDANNQPQTIATTATVTSVQATALGGSTTTVTATPNYGYVFSNWNDNVTDNPRTTIEAANYTANFDFDQFTVTAIVANGQDAMGTASGTATVNYLSNVTLTAQPANGHHFVNWTEADTIYSTDATIEVQALSNRTLTANFAITPAELAWSAEAFTGYVAIDFNNWKPTLTNPHSVNVHYGCVEGNDPDNGGIAVDATTGIIGNETNFGHATLKSGTFHIYAVHETDQNYYYDSVVYTLHVLPSAFVGLSPNIASAGTLSMPNATNVPSLTHHYATVANLPTVMLALNESVNILAEPATGYHFNHWQIPLVPQEETTTAAYTYQFTIPVTVDFQINLLTRTLRAVFDTNTYALNVESANLEMGSGNGSTTAKHFLDYEISAMPNTGYHFVQWNDGITVNPRTVTLTSDSTFTATFAPDTFTITYMDGDVELNVDTFYYLQPITDYTVSKVGWDFLGWNPAVPEVMPAENLTVYAQWYRICDPVTDIDNNTYPSVNINNKCWMAANLRTTHYADGRDITNLYEYTSFLYPSTAENVSIYGRLYDWYDAMDATRPAKAVRVQGICPDGWFIPTQDDFAALDTTDLQNLRSTNFWVVNDGNNSTGFDMRGSGMYNIDNARYEELLCKAYFWTANGTSATEAHCREASYFCNTFLDLIRNKENAFSVRCVKD